MIRQELFCISHVETHPSESICSRAICQGTHFRAGKEGIEERNTYVALRMDVTQIHTQLPYQLHTKLSIRTLSFGRSRQRCIGALRNKDRAVPAMQDAEQPSSSFLGN